MTISPIFTLDPPPPLPDFQEIKELGGEEVWLQAEDGTRLHGWYFAHEDPRLAAGQKQPLQSSNVVTLEPGIYVEGVGGIRIEDDAVVTPGGARILTAAQREFLEL